MNRAPQRPDQNLTPEEIQKRTKKADKLESTLRWSGISEESITEFRGNEDRLGHSWQKFADSVLNNRFKGMNPEENSHGEIPRKAFLAGEAVRPAVRAAADFAMEASTLRESAYRYEYYKAIFNEEAKKTDRESPTTPKTDRLKETSERMTKSVDAHGEFETDKKVARHMEPEVAAHVNLTGSPEDIIASLREHADKVGMENDVSTAYHARKHGHEIPETDIEAPPKQGHEGDEKHKGHHVSNYLKSLRKTIKEGEAVAFTRTKNGEVRLSFKRTTEKEGSSPLYAHLVIDSKNKPRASTYGKGNEPKHEFE